MGYQNFKYFFFIDEEKAEKLRERRNQKGENTNCSYYLPFFERYEEFYRIFTPERMKILYLLRSNGKLTISEIADIVDRNYKNVHNDIKLLLKMGFVKKEKAGRKAFIIPTVSTITVKLFFAPGKQENIPLDIDIDFHESIKELEKIIEEGIGKEIESMLEEPE